MPKNWCDEPSECCSGRVLAAYAAGMRRVRRCTAEGERKTRFVPLALSALTCTARASANPARMPLPCRGIPERRRSIVDLTSIRAAQRGDAESRRAFFPVLGTSESACGPLVSFAVRGVATAEDGFALRARGQGVLSWAERTPWLGPPRQRGTSVFRSAAGALLTASRRRPGSFRAVEVTARYAAENAARGSHLHRTIGGVVTNLTRPSEPGAGADGRVGRRDGLSRTSGRWRVRAPGPGPPAARPARSGAATDRPPRPARRPGPPPWRRAGCRHR